VVGVRADIAASLPVDVAIPRDRGKEQCPYRSCTRCVNNQFSAISYPLNPTLRAPVVARNLIGRPDGGHVGDAKENKQQAGEGRSERIVDKGRPRLLLE
jgi:hypothetical protein